MPNTKVPIELSSTPGIIDNSTVTAITIDSAGAATFSGNVTADGLTVQTTNGLNAVLESTTSYQYLQFKNSGYTENYIDFTNRDFHVLCDNVNRFTINGTTGAATFSDDVGIGVSPTAALDVKGSTSDQLRLRTADTEHYALGRNASTGFLDFYGSQASYAGYTFGGVDGERMRIDASGNVGVGTSSPSTYAKFVIRGGLTTNAGSTSLTGASFSTSDNANSTFWITHAGGTTNLITDVPMAFYTASGSGVAERMRIDASGGIISTADSASFAIDARQTGGNGYGILSRFSAAGLGYMYAAYIDNLGAYKFYVTTAGAVYGNGTYGTISDIKLKENIAAANSQWDDIKAIQLKNYSLIADNLDHADQLGVIAQDLEASGMGKLIDTLEDIDGDGESLGTVTKHVKYSVLHLKALGALQEAMAKIEDLTARLEALEGV